MSTLRADIDAISRAANSIEDDAYAIQADARRGWAIAPVANREGRLLEAKSNSAQAMLPSAEDAARLFSAAHNGSGLGLSGDRRREAPYPPVVQRALAIAALAALGQAGDSATTAALQNDSVSQTCLTESKLNLFQCLAASRPSYEDVFCIGRHVVRDIATCIRGSAQPAASIRVSNVEVVETPRVVVAPPQPSAPAPISPPVATPAPSATPRPAAPVTPSPARTATERLNSGPNPASD